MLYTIFLIVKFEGDCLWGKLPMESLYSAWEKSAGLSLERRSEMLLTIDMWSSVLEVFSFKCLWTNLSIFCSKINCWYAWKFHPLRLFWNCLCNSMFLFVLTEYALSYGNKCNLCVSLLSASILLYCFVFAILSIQLWFLVFIVRYILKESDHTLLPSHFLTVFYSFGLNLLRIILFCSIAPAYWCCLASLLLWFLDTTPILICNYVEQYCFFTFLDFEPRECDPLYFGLKLWSGSIIIIEI